MSEIRLPPEGSLSTLEGDFELYLKEQGKNARTVHAYMADVRRFLKYVGNERLDRISDELVKGFFNQIIGKGKRKAAASVISQFLRFAVTRSPQLPTVSRWSKADLFPAVSPNNEAALRQAWAAERAIQQQEASQDLIAKLARKVIDHYLYFQARLKGGPEHMEDLYRLVDECRELIETNLPLFMALSAKGRNIHSVIDERVQKP